MLRTLNLSRMAQSFEEVAVHAVRNGRSHETYLYELARRNVSTARNGGWSGATRASGLPLEKTFRTLQLARFGPVMAQQLERLRRGTFVAEAVNVVAVGRPGTGKSHAMAALGHELMAQGHTVFWTSTAALVQRLLAAKRDLRLPRELAKLDRFACLILDDIGYVQHDRDEMEVLFTLLAERPCLLRGWMTLTSNASASPRRITRSSARPSPPPAPTKHGEAQFIIRLPSGAAQLLPARWTTASRPRRPPTAAAHARQPARLG